MDGDDHRPSRVRTVERSVASSGRVVLAADDAVGSTASSASPSTAWALATVRWILSALGVFRTTAMAEGAIDVAADYEVAAPPARPLRTMFNRTSVSPRRVDGSSRARASAPT